MIRVIPTFTYIELSKLDTTLAAGFTVGKEKGAFCATQPSGVFENTRTVK